MECNYVRKVTEGLFRKYSTLWQHKGESPITVSKISYTLARGPLNFEAIGFSLSSLYVNLALVLWVMIFNLQLVQLTMNLYWLCYCAVYVYAVHFCDIVWFFSRSESVQIFLKSSNVGIPLTIYTLSHFCVSPKPGPGFLMSYFLVLLMLFEVRGNCWFCWYWWNCWTSHA